MLVEIKTVKKEEVTVVTSLDVAETFGKEHKNVLADIRNNFQLYSMKRLIQHQMGRKILCIT